MLSFVLNYGHSVINALFRKHKIEHEATVEGDNKPVQLACRQSRQQTSPEAKSD